MKTNPIETSAFAKSFAEPTSFSKRLQSVIPFIDPDSSRFIEWFWAVRAEHGLATHSEEITYNENSNVTLDQIADHVKARFPHHFRSKYNFRAFNETEDGVPTEYIVIGSSSAGVMVIMTGSPEFVKSMYKSISETYQNPHRVIIRELQGFRNGEPIKRSVNLYSSEINIAHDAFYPYIEGGVKKLIQDFLSSKSNVMLFIGKPGTGKTTLLRNLLVAARERSIGLADNERVLMDPHFGSYLSTLGRNSLLVIEDADNFVLSRAKGNPQMSRLLGHTDGVLSGDNKVVISTNLDSTNSIDPALLRPGRTHAIVRFRELTAQEANAAREAIGKAPANMDKTKTYTLSEALNFEHYHDVQKEAPRGFGFI